MGALLSEAATLAVWLKKLSTLLSEVQLTVYGKILSLQHQGYGCGKRDSAAHACNVIGLAEEHMLSAVSALSFSGVYLSGVPGRNMELMAAPKVPPGS